MQSEHQKGLIPLLAVACGVTVSSMYYNQPLLVEMGRSLHVAPTRMSHVAVATQLGYAAGLLLFVPLGDVVERRGLIQTLTWGVVASMLLAAAAPSPLLLVLASVAVGMTSAVTHVMLPIAPEVAPRESSGRAVGAVMTGLLLGILLSRTFSGWIGEWLNWRAVFVIAAAGSVVLIVVLRRKLPLLPPRIPVSYGTALRSLWTLVRTQPLLRESAVIGALVFAAFSAFWTMLVFLLESPHYRLGPGVAGSFGVLGAVGASVASIAGRLSDRHGSRFVVSVALALLLGLLWRGLDIRLSHGGFDRGGAGDGCGHAGQPGRQPDAYFLARAPARARIWGPQPDQYRLHDGVFHGRRDWVVAVGAGLGTLELAGRVRAGAAISRARAAAASDGPTGEG